MTSEDELLYWIWLTEIKGLGPVAQHKILNTGITLSELYELSVHKEWRCMDLEKIPLHYRKLLEENTSLEQAKKIYEDCDRLGIRIITISSGLPERFLEYSDLPIMLYALGTDMENMTGVGIVGKRRCTVDMKTRAIELAFEISFEGETIISGMAKGIDSYAHTAAIKQGGLTIAVLGNGVDQCYPIEHKALMEEIMQHGMVISEYPPGTRPTRYNFPRRNRIIAALSKKLHVIGAGENSGTKSTILAAQKYGVPFHYIGARPCEPLFPPWRFQL